MQAAYHAVPVRPDRRREVVHGHCAEPSRTHFSETTRMRCKSGRSAEHWTCHFSETTKNQPEFGRSAEHHRLNFSEMTKMGTQGDYLATQCLPEFSGLMRARVNFA